MKNNLQVRRHEYKYFLSFADYVKARSILKHLTNQDDYHEMGNSYFIRSLYFDDIYSSAVDDKLAGIEFRDKFRLRSYGTELDWVKLERKRKANEYITKTSERINREESKKLINGEFGFLLERGSSARTLYLDFIRNGLRPVVLIDYEREAYTLPYNNIRITFDKNIRSNKHDFRLFEKKVVMKPVLPPDTIVMEVKYNHFLPGWFKTALQLDNPMRAAISKYTLSHLQAGDFNYV